MRWWIVALGVFACAGPSRPERLPRGPKRRAQPQPEHPPPPPLPDAEPPMRVVSADELSRRAWDALGLDGEDWRAKLETIDPDARPEMASWFLQRGNFMCPFVFDADTCPSERPMREIEPTSDIYDPCLRRKIALWAIDQLSDEALYNIYDDLEEIVAIPPPEEELTAKVLSRFQVGFEAAALRWDAKAAGHTSLPPFDVVKALEPDDLPLAASTLHFDDAVLALDPVADVQIYLDAIFDDQLLTPTRLEVMNRLAAAAKTADDEVAEKIRDTLRDRTFSDNCIDAAAASAALAKAEDTGLQLPSGPFARPELVIAATCANLAVGVRGKAWKHVLGADGIEIVDDHEDPFRVDALWTAHPFAYDDDEDGAPDVPEADPDGDGNAANAPVTRTLRWNTRFRLPYADELRLALPACDGVDCPVPGTSVWFHLDIVKERGTKLRLRKIVRHERVGKDC